MNIVLKKSENVCFNGYPSITDFDWKLHASLESRTNEAETPAIHFHECLDSVRVYDWVYNVYQYIRLHFLVLHVHE